MTRFGWSGTVGGGLVVLAFLGLAFALFRSKADDPPDAVPNGTRMPPFAAPLVRGALDGDANLSRGGGGQRSACEVRGPQILNGCQLYARGPVVLAFVARVGDCMTELRRLQQLKRSERALQVAAVAIKGDRDDLQGDLDRLGIDAIPVGWDRDGALSSVYRVIVCPQITFADRGGIVRSTAYGKATLADLRRRAAALKGAE